MLRRTSSAVLVVLLALAGVLGTVARAGATVNPSPTNLITTQFSPSICNTTGLVLGGTTPAVYDATQTHDGCGSVQLPYAASCAISGDPLANTQAGLVSGRCPTANGSGITTPTFTLTPGASYTFGYWMRAESEPKGWADVELDAYNSGGTFLYTVSANSMMPTKAGQWEEQAFNFTAPSTGLVKLHIIRYRASTAPVSKMWVDDFVLHAGWSTRSTPIATKRAFDGMWQKIDADGNFQQKMNDGLFHDWFPLCIARGSRADQSYYARIGFNCFWVSNYTSYGQPWDISSIAPTTGWVWTGSAYVAQNWTHGTSNTLNPLAIAENVTDPEFAPEGFVAGVDINAAIRGNGTAGSPAWDATQPVSLKNAILNINGNGFDRRVGFWMWDAEDVRDKVTRTRALLDLVQRCDSTTASSGYNPGQTCPGGGPRRHPIVMNAGVPGSWREGTASDGTALMDSVGVYSGNQAPVVQNSTDPLLSVPHNYCQLQSGLGWGFKSALYECLGLGNKYVAMWADNNQCEAAIQSCPLDTLHGSTWPAGDIDGNGSPDPDASVGYPYEPVFYSGTGLTAPGASTSMTYNGSFKTISREIKLMAPLLKTGLPSWTVTSSNSNVVAYPRSLAGEAYLIVVNRSSSSQTTMLTVSGVGGTPGTAQNFFTGGSLGTFSGSSLSLTIGGLGQSSGVGDTAGTAVLKITGSAFATTTSTTSAPASTTTTTAPATTTTTATTVSDDAAGSWTYTPTAVTESAGWVQYGPGDTSATGDYLLGNHVTSKAGATVSIAIAGTAATLDGATGPYDGKATVSVDGTVVATIDAYSSTDQRQVPLWSTSSLSPGSHTILVTVLGTRNIASLGEYIVVDKIVTSGATSATTTSTSTTTTTTAPPSNEHLYSGTLPTPSNILASGAAGVVGVRINVTCNGTMPGMWWYRPSTDTGTIQVGLWNTSGTLLASGSGDPAAGPGWRYLAFSSAYTVTSGSTVVAGVLHPSGSYPYSYFGFQSRSVSSPSGCLTAPASSSGNNGVYYVGSTLNYPTSNYQDSEYFVSPQFNPTPTSSGNAVCSGPCNGDGATVAIISTALAAALAAAARRRRAAGRR